MIDGGYGLDECQAMIAAFTAEGTVDYFSLDVGNNWGVPSYIPVGSYEEGEWAPLCGQAKEATTLPVVYAGRVTEPGHGRARSWPPARPTSWRWPGRSWPTLAAWPRPRPAGPLDHPALHRPERVHPPPASSRASRSAAASTRRPGGSARATCPRPARPRSILVIGGGPAGSELAALCAERGHHVELWERGSHLGGQLAIAALARANRRYADWITLADRPAGPPRRRGAS